MRRIRTETLYYLLYYYELQIINESVERKTNTHQPTFKWSTARSKPMAQVMLYVQCVRITANEMK